MGTQKYQIHKIKCKYLSHEVFPKVTYMGQNILGNQRKKEDILQTFQGNE